MKVCTWCNIEKPLDEFAWRYKSKGQKRSECSLCHNTHKREYYRANSERIISKNVEHGKNIRQQFQDWKATKSCEVCGESESCCLDFHHLDPTTKEKEISVIVSYRGWSAIMAEIDKCVIVCSNCHRKIHAGIIQLVEVKPSKFVVVGSNPTACSESDSVIIS